MTDIEFRLSTSRREKLELIMAGCASASSAGSLSHDGNARFPGTTSVGFVRRRLDLDDDANLAAKRSRAVPRASPETKRGTTITDYFKPEPHVDKIEADKRKQKDREKDTEQEQLPLTANHIRPVSKPTSCNSDYERGQLDLAKAHNDLVEYKTKSTAIIMQLLRQLAVAESRERQTELVRNNAELGCRIASQSPHMMNDTWEDGDLFRNLQRKHVRLRQEREELDRERKLATSRRRKLSPGDPDVIAEEDERDEILRLRASVLKRDLSKLQAEEAELEYRRKNHIRFSRLFEEEKRSRFGNYPVLNQRYVVLQLIGKGGFSEVFKAFDLTEHRYVACKIHQLNTSWSIERRRTYTRHASREYEIHKALHHNRIVLLFDVFAIDDQCFCTILEYCEGSDLDMYLKQVDILQERSARCILLQIISGLKYLNSQNPRIIHFDLKPGNILFHKGEIKIADFGLSKLMDCSRDEVELTSPGYGSYWYLPPEVFHSDAIVSSKVDVWSTGVIFYQMLFGKRPFGHDLTARKILMEKTILNATELEFPTIKPPVSAEAKQFIRRCLAHRHQDRPSVFELLEDPYLKNKFGHGSASSNIDNE